MCVRIYDVRAHIHIFMCRCRTYYKRAAIALCQHLNDCSTLWFSFSSLYLSLSLCSRALSSCSTLWEHGIIYGLTSPHWPLYNKIHTQRLRAASAVVLCVVISCLCVYACCFSFCCVAAANVLINHPVNCVKTIGVPPPCAGHTSFHSDIVK